MATRYAFFLCFVIILCSADEEAIDDGFTVKLIPRDSPKSPFYDPLETPYQRVGKAVRRSFTRLAGLRSNAPGDPTADITANDGNYLIKLAIGTPPMQITAIADTGSDLIWTQCKPCLNCFRQEAPLFNPVTSRTYAAVSYHSPKCKLYEHTSPSTHGSLCNYHASYQDNSYSKGYIATETIGLGSTSGSPIKFPNMVFGCGHDNNGSFNNRTSGIVGLGRGHASLTSQMGRRYGGKFSYCLLPFPNPSSSKLKFGSSAHVSGQGTVSTPLFQKSQQSYYYLNLEGMSIDGKKFTSSSCSPRHGAGHGNIVIDSGTVLTSLPRDLYEHIERFISAAIHLPRVHYPKLNLCFRSSGEFNAGPSITVHFSGADVKLNMANTAVFIEKDVFCYAFIPASCDDLIYGTLAQINFLIGYDVAGGRLSFKPANCTHH